MTKKTWHSPFSVVHRNQSETVNKINAQSVALTYRRRRQAAERRAVELLHVNVDTGGGGVGGDVVSVVVVFGRLGGRRLRFHLGAHTRVLLVQVQSLRVLLSNVIRHNAAEGESDGTG
jgi:hypothetical protein